MKTKKKVLISMLAVSATLALGAFMGGCSLSDKIEQWKCDHENITENVVIDPTCYEKGELKETCDDCGKTWTEDIEKVAHTWNDGEVVVEATCTETGITRYTCTVEGCEAVEDRITDKIEHTRVEMPAVAPTCTTVGYTEWYKCGDCGLVLTKKQEIPALGHVETELKAVVPTCTETGLTAGVGCATCGEVITAQTVVPATGHNIVTVAGKPATCTETGLTEGQKCEVCDVVYAEQREIPTLSHSLVTVAGKPATCTETGLTEGQKCEVCGYISVAQTVVPKIIHSNEDGDSFCDFCGFTVDTTNMIEVDAKQGEEVVGNWYRVYRAESFEEYDMDQHYGFQVSFSVTKTIKEATTLGYQPTSFGLNFFTPPKKDFEGNSIVFTASDIVLNNDVWGFEVSVSGKINFVITDDYIDFYIPEDLTFVVNVGDGEYELTLSENAVISSIGAKTPAVKRLVEE